MGDRFDRLGARHANVEALLRRPGIGHNNGPTFDMSWEAWVWRRATATAWKTPSPEVAKMRIRRAERLGLLGDINAVPALSDAERAEFLAIVNRSLDSKVEAIGWGHDGPAIRAMLKSNAVPHQEAFLVGAGIAHQVLGESAGLPFTKD